MLGLKRTLPTLAALLAATFGQSQFHHEWTRFTDGPTHQSDYAVMCETDSQGNTYRIGTTGLDGSGVNADLIVTKHDRYGNLLWSSSLNGRGNSQDIAADLVYKNGYVYVCGRVSQPTNWYADSDLSTSKINAVTGEFIWTKTYSGTFQPGLESSVDGATALAVDEQGNVYVTGFTWEWQYYFPNSDFCTVKYDPNGNYQWHAKYHGGATYIAISDQADFISIGPDGNPVITGDSPGPNNSSEWATIKYDAQTGQTLWVHRSSQAGISLFGVPRSLAIEPGGDVYVAGTAMNNSQAIDRIDGSTGQSKWTWNQRIGHFGLEDAFTLAPNGDPILAVIYDPDGDDSNLNNNIRLTRFKASDGTRLWTSDYGNSVFGNYEAPRAIEALPDGRIVVAGIGSLTPYNSRILLLQYDGSGNLQWSYLHNLLQTSYEIRQATYRNGELTLNMHGNGPNGGTDLAVMRLTGGKLRRSGTGDLAQGG